MAWTSPRTWVAAETVTAALMNTHVRDNLKAVGDAWTAYTPTLGNWTLGNGTLTGASVQAGKLIHYRISYTVGSTDTPSGTPLIGLPVTASSGYAAGASLGTAMLFDTSGTARRYWTAVLNTTTTLIVRDDAGANATATNPWTFATGDVIALTGTYEAA